MSYLPTEKTALTLDSLLRMPAPLAFGDPGLLGQVDDVLRQNGQGS